MTRPEIHPAGKWNGETWKVANAQTGRAKPTTHSKRLKPVRKRGRQ